MKVILALGWYYPDGAGGTERYVAGMARRLAAAGHQVFVAAPDARAQTVRFDDHEGIRVLRYPAPLSPTRDEVQGRVRVRGAERLHRWLAEERPDIFHLHTFTTGLGLMELEAARSAGARTFVTAHESTLGFTCLRGTLLRLEREPCHGITNPHDCAECILHHRGLPRALAGLAASARLGLLGRMPGRAGTVLGLREFVRFNQARQHRLLESVEQLLVMTETARRILLVNGAPPEKVSVSRLGVDHLGAVKPGPAERPARAPIKIGYLGRLDPVKGLDDLVGAVVRLPRSVPLELEVRGPVGDGRLLSELRAQASGDPRVHFADGVPSHAVPEVLRGYDLLVCPSRCLEGGPTVALEAHGVGTPVIGSRLGGLFELLPDDGRLFTVGDRAGLAALLQGVAADPRGTIDRWRASLPQPRTMDDVAREHLVRYAA